MGTANVGARAAPENMRWEFRNAKEFERSSHEWDAINDAASGVPALTAVFVALLLKEFGTGRELLAVGYRGGTVHAMAVLHCKYGVFWETFQPAQAPLGAWIHRPPHTLESLVPGLLRDLPGFALAIAISRLDPELVRRPEDCGTVTTLDCIRASRVTLSGSFDEYWVTSRDLSFSLTTTLGAIGEGDAARLYELTQQALVPYTSGDGSLTIPGLTRNVLALKSSY